MKYTVYTKETVYRTFEVETDDDLIAEHDREKLTSTDLVADYDATEVGDHDHGDLEIVMVELSTHAAARTKSNWWSDPWENEPPTVDAMRKAGLANG